MHTYEHDSMAGKQEAGEKRTHGGRLVSLSSLDIVTQLLKSIKLDFVWSSFKNMGVKKSEKGGVSLFQH